MSLVYRQLNRAALQGNVQALREIGLMHATNEGGAEKDELLSIQVLLRSLSLGDIQSLLPLALTVERRAGGNLRLLQRAEEMLQYFLESGGPREAEGAPEGTGTVPRGAPWFRGLWRSAGCRAALWRIRIKKRLHATKLF
ncbi:hypothetical protein ETH_00000630 [Eimeria tenella]|uniref:Uncharacterized protein n=1 Tax=Eimeria tenella TaxID=5802 RepID=U6LBB8_EIMTE|nr:hypothetical protein ETH_00000630 [Eimeria tenella]CDJ45050.1 hypothetical protein ETH_00000630 [Eimeria tenella]|eukprot:XP_013235797.1 hypothetical protein ETH_00000630 [Eimeria tenella]